MGIKQKAIQIICFLFFIQSLKAQLNCKDYVKLIDSLNLIKYNNLYYSATSDSINFERIISYANVNDTSILKEISISVIQPSNQNLNFEHCFDVNLNKIYINDFLLLKDTIVLTKSENRKIKRYEELLKKSIELLEDENFSVSKEKRLHKRINKIDLELINKKNEYAKNTLVIFHPTVHFKNYKLVVVSFISNRIKKIVYTLERL
ncbi:hypothetical protein GCM10027036_23460 [Flavihumibacter cheonanensis]|uniref:hypothetical protein n=1 Tax=Flavihumibacter cheonanensis TaxID=1442385 RepID=UPI001EF7E565|nr:hypothetical protein [Flavihumibacter cheonanensis]MCG7754474.1 hypothetical protein [Flavihumibacter cheonanensis]